MDTDASGTISLEEFNHVLAIEEVRGLLMVLELEVEEVSGLFQLLDGGNGTISYDEFIALCFLQMQGRDPDGQRDITLGIMRSLMPPGGDKIFRKLFPTNKFSLELNAVICKIVFAWMVGPMEVESTTENDLGEMIASKVHIKKCRWLQESGCTGMCVNMCKTATQDFFVNDFGLPLTIKPNFEDKSCDFYFGLTPPPIEKDEALTFGCNSTCGTAVVRRPSHFQSCFDLVPFFHPFQS